MSDTARARIRSAGPDSIAVNAVGDQPTTADSLGFAHYVEAIARFLTADATKPPITISIEGDWGSGKSSFLLQLENAIRGGSAPRRPIVVLSRWLGGNGSLLKGGSRQKALTVRFNAWRHDKQDALWAAFALAFVKSLRAEVGMLRAWRGDIRLFLMRLNGLQAWLELTLALVSAVVLFLGAVKLSAFIHANPGDAGRLLDWLVSSEPATKPKPDEKPGEFADMLRYLASYGAPGTIVALGAAGVHRFWSYVRMPLSWKLEKYISKPDYEGHVSFIENFHSDLNNLIEAYAGSRRVFIFIDDLDRCDVPRAADLMQAINLMIGDSKNLVFVIGMDREKVAAGIAQKYKDLLPFLRESAHWKPNDEKDDYTPLYFGFGYLEKFIQISFSLPIASSEATLDTFLKEESKFASRLAWPSRLIKYWNGRFGGRNIVASEQGPMETAETGQTPQVQAALPLERAFNRLKLERDSKRIHDIVKIVSIVFEYNPRRIKQFINTFRLALYIASEQGLFDETAESGPQATPEQIGKFVALLLRFPDLRFALEQDDKLLATLQELALKAPADRDVRYHWLDKPGTVRLLVYGCEPRDPLRNYSFTNFDVRPLFSVVPRAATPPSPSDVTEFDKLADRYEAIRKAEPGSPARTRKMTAVVHEALGEAARLSFPGRALDLLGASGRPGARLMRILIASAHKDPANLSWLIDYCNSFASPFEHYWCIRTLVDYDLFMTDADRAEINIGLEARWSEIEADQGRVALAKRLRELTRAHASGSAAPRSAASVTSPPKRSGSAKRGRPVEGGSNRQSRSRSSSGVNPGSDGAPLKPGSSARDADRRTRETS